MNDKNIENLEYTSNVDEVFNTISNLDVCVSMRYHGTLISNMLGVPTLNLLYDIHKHYKIKLDIYMKITAIKIIKWIILQQIVNYL